MVVLLHLGRHVVAVFHHLQAHLGGLREHLFDIVKRVVHAGPEALEAREVEAFVVGVVVGGALG